MAQNKTIEINAKPAHECSGGIIIRDRKILIIDRANFPKGWACPAGHVETNETPEAALVREINEETGLTVTFAKEILTEFVSWNECVYGVKGHFWHVYVVAAEGNVKVNKEAKSFKWVTPKQIKELIKSAKTSTKTSTKTSIKTSEKTSEKTSGKTSGNLLEPVWKYFFEKLLPNLEFMSN